MICLGCGSAAGKPFMDVAACDECVAAFVEVFGQEPKPEGLMVPDGPAARLGNAVLAELGESPARSIAPPVRVPVVWRDVRMPPRRGKLRR